MSPSLILQSFIQVMFSYGLFLQLLAQQQFNLGPRHVGSYEHKKLKVEHGY